MPELRRFRPNINWVRVLLVPALALIALGLDRGYQTDFWHHLARGRVLAAGLPANVDSFTFTIAGQPVCDANGLTQLIFYKLFAIGGLSLVQSANALVIAAAFGLLGWHCRRSSGCWATAAWVGVGTLAGIWPTLLIRPQSASIFLFVVLHLALDASRARRWLLVVPPLLMGAWVNLHGGFLIGLLLLSAATLAELLTWIVSRTRRFPIAVIASFAASCGATLANPYGFKVYHYALTLSRRAASRGIEEWLPPGLQTSIGWAFMLSLMVVVVLLALGSSRPSLHDICLIVVLLPLACGSVRMVVWWLLAIAPWVARALADVLGRIRHPHSPDLATEWTRRPALRPALMLIVLVGGAVFCQPALARINPLFRVRSSHRIEADLESLVARIPELDSRPHVFTRLEWGEYLDWAGQLSFIDGRIEAYPDSVWSRYLAITSGRADWERLLIDSGANVLLLDQAYHVALEPLVRQSPRWRQVAEAGSGRLYVRVSEKDMNPPPLQAASAE